MRKRLGVVVAVMMVGLGLIGVMAVPVMASGGAAGGGVQGGLQGGADTAVGGGMVKGTDVPSIIKQVINIILYIAGVLAVGFIVFGGVKYMTSSGDSSKVKAAKDTILYAVMGLMVTMLAYVIVNFVITNLGGSNGEAPVGGGGDTSEDVQNTNTMEADCANGGGKWNRETGTCSYG